MSRYDELDEAELLVEYLGLIGRADKIALVLVLGHIRGLGRATLLELTEWLDQEVGEWPVSGASTACRPPADPI